MGRTSSLALIYSAVSIIAVTILKICTKENTPEDSMKYSAVMMKNRILPSTSNSMTDLVAILNALENNIPFGFAHFNDGEIEAMNYNEGFKTVYSWMQDSSSLLTATMQKAFLNTADNFYIGIPCNCEFRGCSFLLALRYLNISHNLPYHLTDDIKHCDQYHEPDVPESNDKACPITPTTLIFSNDKLKNRITVSTLFINGNYIRAKKELTRILGTVCKDQGRMVHVVTAYNRTIKNLPFPVKSVQYIAEKNAFQINYETIRTKEFLEKAEYKSGDVVLIMAGPLGRILSSEWTSLRSDVTFLELGSFWDTELWNRPKHHLGLSRSCMSRDDTIGIPCRNTWIHPLSQIFYFIPEGYIPYQYFC
jgi:hypothetical protein